MIGLDDRRKSAINCVHCLVAAPNFDLKSKSKIFKCIVLGEAYFSGYSQYELVMDLSFF